jgi:sortase (surface protein transpeptidase)
MEKERAKKLFKIAVFIYLASFLIINWNDVSWAFNYKEVSGLLSDFFNPYPSIDASTMDVYFYPNHSLPAQAGQNSTTVAIQPIENIKTNYTDKQNTLEIPKISISIPIVFPGNSDKASLMKDLDLGAIFYPGSVYPGQPGQIVILGHSAPPGWPKIKHDWIFTDLDKLEKKIVARGADVPTSNLSANANILTLISCWPPGKDYQRIAVVAELQIN